MRKRNKDVREGSLPSPFHLGGSFINILAVDQARCGAWSVFHYETKELLAYGTWDFPLEDFRYETVLVEVERIIAETIRLYDVSAVFVEDIQFRKSYDAYKKLAMLRGVLVALFERNHYLYHFIAPVQWQNYCKSRTRTTKEIKKKLQENDAKESKVLSIQFAREQFGIETENDNLADSLGLGWYALNNIEIQEGS